MKKGLFITLEGGEGVGKSTNLVFIKQLLEDKGIPVITTREPGGTIFAEKIRQLLLEKPEATISEKTE
jgi:dTMP kinase